MNYEDHNNMNFKASYLTLVNSVNQHLDGLSESIKEAERLSFVLYNSLNECEEHIKAPEDDVIPFPFKDSLDYIAPTLLCYTRRLTILHNKVHELMRIAESVSFQVAGNEQKSSLSHPGAHEKREKLTSLSENDKATLRKMKECACAKGSFEDVFE
ncbi:hypothetical protein KCM76_23050 [Zooshikella marina]|uniref:hypothetical protein n=1 Tax=Zooshikella ganghwensis TaxID=202772 RepID=UPI001BAFC4EE|nr:hypothetical protein [Zooshikella ganghwensis]MBU2708891.1 hypothetical protein [Zooshikella ganghwensis]